MNKKILLIVIGLLLIFIAFFLLSRKVSILKQTSPQPTDIPEVTSVILPTYQPLLNIVSTTPTDKAISVPLSQVISIVFNRTYDINQLEFIVNPKFEFKKSQTDNTLVITPIIPLQPGTLYTYSLWDKTNSENFRQTFTFTTIGPTPEFLPDTRPVEVIQAEENFLRENRPDIFLKNLTPYSSEIFSITSDYRSPPQSHFYFLVTLKSTDQSIAELSKQEFISWLKSLKLTDQQIQALDITYYYP